MFYKTLNTIWIRTKKRTILSFKIQGTLVYVWIGQNDLIIQNVRIICRITLKRKPFGVSLCIILRLTFRECQVGNKSTIILMCIKYKVKLQKKYSNLKQSRYITL